MLCSEFWVVTSESFRCKLLGSFDIHLYYLSHSLVAPHSKVRNFWGSTLGSMISNFGAKGRDSNPTNRLLGRWFNRRKPSWPITPASPGVVSSGSGTSHYCPNVPHTMSKSGLNGSGQWMHLWVPFFFQQKQKKKKVRNFFLPFFKLFCQNRYLKKRFWLQSSHLNLFML